MDDRQRQMLLAFVRATLQSHLAGDPPPAIPPIDLERSQFGGAFVTLRRGRMLRGCIGRFATDVDPLLTIREMAKASLTDPRFVEQPVLLEELPDLWVEVSILSPMARTDDPLSLEVGRHGVLIRKGTHSGCFLPQVATEQGWDKEQLLSYCCSGKAGLPSQAWRDPETEVDLFTAEVISEAEPAG